MDVQINRPGSGGQLAGCDERREGSGIDRWIDVAGRVE